jgi:SAM-dependent methyltransferase
MDTSIHLLRAPPKHERRSAAQLREQYEIEKSLAARLRTASRADRRELYSSAYDELFRRVPHHSQLTKKASVEERKLQVAEQLRFLDPFLTPQSTFLEIGAGDCALSLAASTRVQQVYAVDVSEQITHTERMPRNFSLILTDGTSIPVPRCSVDLAYSNQLMEHLHPDDALEQLANIFNVLKPGGRYICLTPNQLTGPHDVSRYFDRQATGFHLREYTFGELVKLMRQVGFAKTSNLFRVGGRAVRMPFLMGAAEAAMSLCPSPLRGVLADNRKVRTLLEIRMLAEKPLSAVAASAQAGAYSGAVGG